MIQENDVLPRATEPPFLSALHAKNDTTNPFGYKLGDNEVAHLAEGLGMRVHTITAPYHHVLRNAHTVYLFGSLPALRDLGETERLTDLVSSLGKELLLCDVTTGQWYKRAPSDQSFTPLITSTFPVLHPRSAVLGVRSLPLYKTQLTSLFQRTEQMLAPTP